MLALVAGTGALPSELVAQLRAKGQPPLICEMAGFVADLPQDLPRLGFRLETLGTFLATLVDMGVSEVCFAGAVQRPAVSPELIDAATLPLVPRMVAAMQLGDDGALREVIAIFEEAGLTVRAAHEIAPELLPGPGVLTSSAPDAQHRRDARIGDATLLDLGHKDQGQACVIAQGKVVAVEDRAGTDAMLHSVSVSGDAILFKAPKPDQDRRADLPVIGPQTAVLASGAGLSGIVIEAGGVMVLDLPSVIETLNTQGLFLWVRPRGEV